MTRVILMKSSVIRRSGKVLLDFHNKGYVNNIAFFTSEAFCKASERIIRIGDYSSHGISKAAGGTSAH